MSVTVSGGREVEVGGVVSMIISAVEDQRRGAWAPRDAAAPHLTSPALSGVYVEDIRAKGCEREKESGIFELSCDR